MARTAPRLFAALTPGGERNLLDTLREERTGGLLLLAGTAVALVWANLAPASYTALSSTVVGPAALHLDLTLAQWATDGLLAVFFFVVGLELKREVVAGELRDPRTAVVPIVAAVGGMLVPAALYLAVNLSAPDGVPKGWAVPTATDIAFAVAVLAVVGRSLPNALRAFLLTLAVVDDLLAIVVIGVVYTDHVALVWLGAALLTVAVFAVAVARGVTTGWVLVPLAVVAWALMHASGVHATIAGVLLGVVVPATPRATQRALRLPAPPEESLAERWEHRWRPVSAGFAVPVFALFAAGVTFSAATLTGAVGDPVAQGVALGLVVGKPLGILGATWLVARFTRAELAPGLGWADVLSVGLVAGIGFTVSLLVGELAFGAGSAHDEHVVVAVLVASVTAALAGGGALWLRDRHHATTSEPPRTR
ncbi:Na+/H+ antiporter NhaA [Cellulomonas fimi]|uniref:Na(+)/H(+) antiporter NhaA n=1 Tax=Cellulomonas fimi (strain ATCC 484 / DSM 20113 / JCM 1341 / CCUG 24087 / LMG 16345 / NBRC 15513 / NCIMB 8980 / NCTC 7547 / NRS-133) TaxID=590998 RepID=F4H1S8_CELFA|nr:Na+/H+ antiporter NhaA [Cellulomonas fimi]AEE47498.1 Na+/H+ antiporter NhaA [Cellulomonas fimi ATCC 484]NNH05526.1 Na+/H+ antiporter NhaA [Cellulomonas fimi]VEH36388.1 Sodium/proton antiporter nhaA [Cellulomonas fimi]